MDKLVSHMIDHDLNFAKSIIMEGKEFLPQLTFVARENGHDAIFPVAGLGELFESDEKKRNIPGVVKTLWQQITADKKGLELLAVTMTADAWVEYPTDEEFERLMRHGREKPFESNPGMAESIVVMVYLAETDWRYTWPYVRGKERIVFAEKPTGEEDPQGPHAFLRGLWPL